MPYHACAPLTANEARAAHFVGSRQPSRRSFEIDHIRLVSQRVEIRQSDVLRLPFCELIKFEKVESHSASKLLVVPPLSGHFPFLLRDLVVTLLTDHDVFVLDWINARYIPLGAGGFGLEENAGHIIQALRAIGGVPVVALCQAGIPALAATARLAEANDPAAPRALALIAAPVDPLAAPTPVVRRLRARPIDWFERFVLSDVAADFPGAGRRVYPAWVQLSGLVAYLARHLAERGELHRKVFFDDGADPAVHSFVEGYASIMDLPAEVFLDTVRHIYQERSLLHRGLSLDGQSVDCSAIGEVSLMTVEGALDDVVAPGQTAAAHDLCLNVPAARRARYVLEGGGHFSTFHGRLWRAQVAPRLNSFFLKG